MTLKEIMDRCKELRVLAMLEVSVFDESKYEWELGAAVVRRLEEDIHEYCILNHGDKDEKHYLMGIPVRINLADVRCIKLWREIK